MLPITSNMGVNSMLFRSAALSLCVLCGIANATPVLTGSAVASACEANEFNCNVAEFGPAGPVSVSGVSLLSVTDQNAQKSGEGFGTAAAFDSSLADTGGTVSYGLITGNGFSSADENNFDIPPNTNINNTTASTTFDGSFRDTVTVTAVTLGTGSGLSSGAPVTLRFQVSQAFDVLCQGNLDTNDANVAAEFSVNGVQVASVSDDCHSPVSSPLLGTAIVNTQVGAQLDIEGSLVIETNAQGFNLQANEANADPPSAHFYIDALTPGAAYTSASSTDYESRPATNVAEPSTLALLGLGLMGVWLADRRRESLR